MVVLSMHYGTVPDAEELAINDAFFKALASDIPVLATVSFQTSLDDDGFLHCRCVHGLDYLVLRPEPDGTWSEVPGMRQHPFHAGGVQWEGLWMP